MIIKTNEAGEIIAYTEIGGIEGGLDVAQVPADFKRNYKPGVYLYVNGEIVTNPNYREVPPAKPPESELDTLRKQVAELQAMVQALLDANKGGRNI